MKERNQYEIKKLNSSRLYLDDFTGIDKIFKKNCETYEIKTKEYTFSSIEELKKIYKETITVLTIKSQNPHVILNFYDSFSEVHYHLNNMTSVGMVSKIEEILKNRKFHWGNIYFRGFLIFFCFIIAAIFLLYFNIISSPVLAIITTSLLLIQVLTLPFQFKKYSIKHTIIYLYQKKEKLTFLKRNKDQILISLINIIIGFGMGVMAMWIKGKYFK